MKLAALSERRGGRVVAGGLVLALGLTTLAGCKNNGGGRTEQTGGGECTISLTKNGDGYDAKAVPDGFTPPAGSKFEPHAKYISGMTKSHTDDFSPVPVDQAVHVPDAISFEGAQLKLQDVAGTIRESGGARLGHVCSVTFVSR